MNSSGFIDLRKNAVLKIKMLKKTGKDINCPSLISNPVINRLCYFYLIYFTTKYTVLSTINSINIDIIFKKI